MGFRDRIKRGAIRALDRLGDAPAHPSRASASEPAMGAPGPTPDYEMPDHIFDALREITEEEALEAVEEQVVPPVAASGEAVTKGDKETEEEEVFDGEPVSPEDAARMETEVIDAIKTVFDPEIPVNIYELGLIYDVGVHPGAVVVVRMTLTSPNCPAAQSLPAEVKEKSTAVEGVEDARVKVVWDPPWGPQMMTEAAQLELNLM